MLPLFVLDIANVLPSSVALSRNFFPPAKTGMRPPTPLKVMRFPEAYFQKRGMDTVALAKLKH